MATKFTLLNEIVAGKTDWNLKVRVINLWNVPVKNAVHDIQSIELVFLDAKNNKIGATVPKRWVSQFRDSMKEGSAYLIHNVTVAQNDIKYKKTTHKYKLTFMRTTKISTIPSEDIPLFHFDFSEFPVILAESRTDLIVDVIGHVVEKDNLKEMEKDGRRSILLDLVLQDLGSNRVNCTLWGPYARRMQAYFDNQTPDSANELVVVVIQLGRLTKFLGINGVATGFYGTKLMINEAIPTIANYKANLMANEAASPQPIGKMIAPAIVSIHEELLNTPKMTIADLIDSTKECFGAVVGTVVEINTEKGWSYNSCNKCLRVVGMVDNKFYCGNCNANVTAAPRYKVHLQVIDSTGSTTFTLFNSLVATYVGMTAEALIRSNDQRHLDGDIPEEFNIFFGKEFIFKVQVADINIRRGWQTYTVKKFSSDESLIKDFVHKNLIYGTQDGYESDLQRDLEKLEENPPVILLDEYTPIKGSTSNHVSDLPPPPNIINLADDTPIKHEAVIPDSTNTPPLKISGKRHVTEIAGIDPNNLDFSSVSGKKLPKKVNKTELKE